MAPDPQEVEDFSFTETGELDIDAEIVELDQPVKPTPSAKSEKEATVLDTGEAKPPAQPSEPKKVNLDDFEDFRKFKGEQRRKEEDYKRKLALAEQQLAQREAEQQQFAMQALRSQLDTTADDEQRMQIIEQIAAIRGQDHYQRERAWADYVAKRVQEEGLEPGDFTPTKYRGEAGALQFERDVNQAAKETLRKRLEQAEKAASPQALEAQITAAVARALRAKGIDARVETGEPSAPPSSDDEWDRDVALVEAGKVPRNYLTKKYSDVRRRRST